MEKKQEGILHLCLWIMLQWLSLAVVVLNAVALTLSKQHPQLQNKLVSSYAGAQDGILIVLGVVSFLAASVPFCLHLVVYYRSQRSFAPSKLVLISELAIGVVMVILWTGASSIVLTHFHVSSNCRLDVLSATSACRMLNVAIIIGLSAIAGWILLLIVAAISMTQLSVTPIFVLESNPYLTTVNDVGGYQLEKQLSAAPSYSSLPPLPPSLPTRKSGTRHSYVDLGYPQEYPTDVKYPIYSIDSLPVIHVGGSKFDDLSFLH